MLRAHAIVCATAEFRQFDFWLGDWEVRDRTGKKTASFCTSDGYYSKK
jgi:hypothetical protein